MQVKSTIQTQKSNKVGSRKDYQVARKHGDGRNNDGQNWLAGESISSM